jgi:kynurenine formamidase
MCLAGTTAAVHQHHLDRRGFLKMGAGTAAAAAIATVGPALPAAARHQKDLVDLTHRLTKTFPTFTGLQPSDVVLNDYATSGFYAKQWTFGEHTGTHLDSPGHFVEGNRLVDELTPEELVVPLAVIDIRARASVDPDAAVTVEDLVRFEHRYGRIPRRALVAMNSGWADKVGDTEAYLGGPAFPNFHFPGFGVEAVEWLLSHRSISGIGVDTTSIDIGASLTFEVHLTALGADKYGLENLANLDRVPPRGALAYVGVIPWEEGSGGPARVIAAL